MRDTAPATPLRWRPSPLWAPMGLILGAACGAVVGAVMFEAIVLLEGDGFAYEWAIAGLVYGAMCGGVVGLLVGLVMTFLVGSHLPLARARERAFLVGLIATGLPVLLLLGVLFGSHPVAIVAALMSALAGGSLSYWVASFGAPRGTGL